jgi:hypothetical protein
MASIGIQGERPAPVRLTPSALEQPMAIAANLEHVQVLVKEESAEEPDMRGRLPIILCSRFTGPPKRSQVTMLFNREFNVMGKRSVDLFREPNATDGFLEEIEATDGMCIFLMCTFSVTLEGLTCGGQSTRAISQRYAFRICICWVMQIMPIRDEGSNTLFRDSG